MNALYLNYRSSSAALSQAVLSGVTALGGLTKGKILELYLFLVLFDRFLKIFSSFSVLFVTFFFSFFPRLWFSDDATAPLHGLLSEHTR